METQKFHQTLVNNSNIQVRCRCAGKTLLKLVTDQRACAVLPTKLSRKIQTSTFFSLKLSYVTKLLLNFESLIICFHTNFLCFKYIFNIKIFKIVAGYFKKERKTQKEKKKTISYFSTYVASFETCEFVYKLNGCY